MNYTFLLLTISLAAAFSAPTGEPKSQELLSFIVTSKNGVVGVADSLECAQHFLDEISKGTYQLDLPHLNQLTDGDTVSESHQLLVKSGPSTNGCTMLWSLSGVKEDLPHLVLKNRTKRSLVSDLLAAVGLALNLDLGLNTNTTPKSTGKQ